MDRLDSIGARYSQSIQLVALLALVVTFFAGCDRGDEAAPKAVPGRNILVSDVAGGKGGLQLLETISWNDVVPTAEGVSSDKAFTRRVIEATATQLHPPALYLRGILLLSAEDPQSALAAFELIPPGEIPAELLYAPYRLHNALNPRTPNPFLTAILRAVELAQVPTLIQARVLATDGRMEQALKSYLRTDPADWTTQDAAHLRALRFQAGLANDTAAMIQAALKAGRVRESLRSELIDILNAPRDQESLENMKAQLVYQIQTDPGTREAAIKSAQQQLSVRQQFMEKNYRALLDQHRDRPAVELPDETVLMLMLSAAQLRDGSALELWSQEMTRRYPTPEVEKWTRELQEAAR
jgi:hypothetical protein